MDTARLLDLADFGEVRRRVVDPVLTGLLRPGELTAVDLVADHDWPRDPDDRWPVWMDSPFTTRPGDAPKSLFLILRAGRDDRHGVQLGELGFFRVDVADLAPRVADSLVDWIAESGFGRGEARQLAANVIFPPAVTRVDGRPVVWLEMNEAGRPELDVAGRPTSPGALGLSPALLADLDAWVAAVGEDLEALFGALERVRQARINTEYVGRPPGIRLLMSARKKAAAARKRAGDALDQAPLGRWSRLVAEHEPRRDGLLGRLRDELGPGFHVPTPARIP